MSQAEIIERGADPVEARDSSGAAADDDLIDDTGPGKQKVDVIGSTSATTNPEPPATMPEATAVDFHSQSDSILAASTPFTTESRFEYPFPDTRSSSSPSNPSSSSNSGSFVGSSSQTLSTLTSPPSITTQFPPLNISLVYSSKHPKMRAPANPPVPPSLMKKAQRWSLGLLRRRNSSASASAPSSPAETGAGAQTQESSSSPSSSDPSARQATVLEDPAAESHAQIPTPPAS
ncbi:hypothetical protein DXG03_007324 [Asterophora parasitica]|uniref:Uncharacterized protein n=1 Tax=Asterophora parasitica TaxID=117018 RepID=A0A9P7KD75_9AGAR|nr:hypothetical protein DXG03_007324 [Asterophora parasitica]